MGHSSIYGTVVQGLKVSHLSEFDCIGLILSEHGPRKKVSEKKGFGELKVPGILKKECVVFYTWMES